MRLIEGETPSRRNAQLHRGVKPHRGEYLHLQYNTIGRHLHEPHVIVPLK